MQARVTGEPLKEADVGKNRDTQRVAKVRDDVISERKGNGESS